MGWNEGNLVCCRNCGDRNWSNETDGLCPRCRSMLEHRAATLSESAKRAAQAHITVVIDNANAYQLTGYGE